MTPGVAPELELFDETLVVLMLLYTCRSEEASNSGHRLCVDALGRSLGSVPILRP